MVNHYPLKKRILFFLPTSIILLVLDQAVKMWAVESLKGQFPKVYFYGMAQLTYAENTGAWGNLGGNWGEPWRTLFLIALPLIVLGAFSGFAIFSKKLSKIEFWSYLLIAAGGAGNLIDRIRFGYVVDMFYLGIKRPFETNIFNIADVVIMIGFGLMLIHLFQDWKERKGTINKEDPPLPPNL